MSGTILFYAKENCIFCTSLEADLKSLGLPYIKKYPNPEDIPVLKQVTGMSTFPMLFFGSNLIGGYQEFNSLVMTNQLNEKLKEIGINVSIDF